MTLHRRSFLKLAGLGGTSSALGVSAPAIVRAATPIKLTLPWLPLGTYSFTFVAKKLGFWDKRGLDVTIDRGFGSTKVCVPVDQGQVEPFKQRGLGYIDPALADITRQSVITYMGIKDIPPADQLYTDQFAGAVTLTPDQWTKVEARVKKELPSTVE
jgi:hypothetical protein